MIDMSSAYSPTPGYPTSGTAAVLDVEGILIGFHLPSKADADLTSNRLWQAYGIGNLQQTETVGVDLG